MLTLNLIDAIDNQLLIKKERKCVARVVFYQVNAFFLQKYLRL